MEHFSVKFGTATVFEISCGKTDRQTNAADNHTLGVGNKQYHDCDFASIKFSLSV